MKYVIKQPYNGKYVDINGDVYTTNCMCYRLNKMKWFNTLEEAKEYAHKVIDSYWWERTYSSGIAIYTAIIERHVDNYGNRYTTVDCGDLVERIPFNPNYDFTKAFDYPYAY